MLATLLSAARSARDLTVVFEALGYQTASAEHDGALAQWRGFRVVAVDDPDPARRAALLARELARTAERSLAVAIGNGQVAFAAVRLGGGPVASLVVEQGDGAAARRLERLRPRPNANALAHALRIADVLANEPVGARFFSAFRSLLDRMAATVDGRASADDRRLAALLALTRVLFLYFIQAKGWLDNRRDYLPALLDQSLERGRHFHRSALHPLFFGTLNRPPAARSARLRLGRVPYLNGGLFEPHPVERRLGPVVFSNTLWRDAFDGLFERFHFCVTEGDDVTAIAPDMLGHVFERVMASDERRNTGTFYTPDRVVRQVVDATIDAALGEDRGLPALKRLRLLDPAAGSGAFLLGALSRLTALRGELERPPDAAALRAIRIDVLRHNLFGVDLSPIAVRLAELRLWLAVVADDPTGDIAAIAPLPNLDGVVRQGDTLLDPLGLARAYDLTPAAPPRSAVSAVSSARQRFFLARGPERHESARALRNAEHTLARAVVTNAFKSATEALRDLAGAARSKDLFGRRTGLDARQRRRWVALIDVRRTLRRVLTRMRDGTVPFFSFDTHAPDILAEGGFSAVIGNPPWVRAERLTKAERQALTTRFSLWRGTEGRGYAHQPDLAVAFLQRALELTRPAGAIGLLVPSKIATAQYGGALRTHLVRETQLVHVHRVPDAEAQSFGAVTYPLAIVARKQPPAPDHRVQLGLGHASAVSQRVWQSGGPWILVPDRARDAIERFRSSGMPLSRVATPALGVKTGADDILVGAVVQSADALTTVRFASGTATIETELLRTAIRGRDVRPYRANPAVVLLWGYSGNVVRRSLPRAATRYVAEHRAGLERRTDHRGGPAWTLFRTAGATRDHRVVWADIARVPSAVALDEVLPAAVPLNTCYVASLPDRDAALAVTAVLNSTFNLALVHAVADEARGGYRRVNARVAGLVPVPAPGPHYPALVSLARTAHKSRHVCQSDLDAAVAAALDLPVETCRTLAAAAKAALDRR